MFIFLSQETPISSYVYFFCYLVFVVVHILIFSKESGNLFFMRIAQKQNPGQYHTKKNYYFYYGKHRMFYSIVASEVANMLLLILAFLYVGAVVIEKDSIHETDLYGFILAFECMMYLAGIYVVFYFIIGARCVIHAILPVRHRENYTSMEAVLTDWIPYGRRRKRYQPALEYLWKDTKVTYIGPPMKQKFEIGETVTFYYDGCKKKWLWEEEKWSLLRKGIWYIVKPFLFLLGTYFFLVYL